MNQRLLTFIWIGSLNGKSGYFAYIAPDIQRNVSQKALVYKYFDHTKTDMDICNNHYDCLFSGITPNQTSYQSLRISVVFMVSKQQRMQCNVDSVVRMSKGIIHEDIERI